MIHVGTQMLLKLTPKRLSEAKMQLEECLAELKTAPLKLSLTETRYLKDRVFYLAKQIARWEKAVARMPKKEKVKYDN